MFTKILHIVHWKNSGIYHVTQTLSQYKNSELDHEIVYLKDENGNTNWKQIKRLFFSLFSKRIAIHTHSFLPSLILPFKIGKKFTTFHSDYPFLTSPDLKSKMKRSVLRIIIKVLNVRVTSISPKIKSLLKSHLRINSCVIFNPVDIDVLGTITAPQQIKVFGLMGRFDHEKNFEAAIKAFMKANTRGMLTLVIAGEGQLRGKLIELAKNCPFKSINFIGQVENKIDFYNKIDCLICSSFYEGGPLVVVEAMLANKLVISTEVGLLKSFSQLQYIQTGNSARDIEEAINKSQTLSIDTVSKSIKTNQIFCEKSFNIDTIYTQYSNKLWLI